VHEAVQVVGRIVCLNVFVCGRMRDNYAESQSSRFQRSDDFSEEISAFSVHELPSGVAEPDYTPKGS
jgi:hypothetical protein